MSSSRGRSLQINFNHLHYFHVAAVEGSVGGAAQQLGVTQPTVSEQLRALERSLGVTLFERQSSGLKLTEAGRRTFQHTSVMFGAAYRLAEELDMVSHEAATVLRIGVSNCIARESMPDLLTPLLDLHDCMPSIRVGEYTELARDLRNARLDVVLCETEPPKAERHGFDVTLVERMTMSVVTHPSIKPSSDWREVALLQYRTGSKLRWEVDAFLKARGLSPRIAAEVDDAGLLLDAVVRGGHIAILPLPLVREALARERMSQLERFETQQTGVFALFSPGAITARVAVDRLLQHVKTRVPPTPAP